MSNRKNFILNIIFWIIVLISLAVIGFKFFASQEQPMETKILFVFITFVFCSVLFRWIKKQSTDSRLHQWTQEAMEWSDTGISAVLLAFVIMAFILQAFKIPSGSMQPTLLIGDHLFVNKFIYGTQIPFTLKKVWNLKKIKRFDVVVFLCPPHALSDDEREKNVKKDFIKRAIGLPGDILEVKDKVIYINGEKINDPYGNVTSMEIFPKHQFWKTQQEYQEHWERGEFVYLPVEAVRDNFGPIQVPPQHYFVVGDNRDGSFDSRFWGPLPEKYLKGKAWIVYWPPSRFGSIR